MCQTGAELYWQHLRYGFDPEERKRYDLHFLRHVADAHDGEPSDPVEKRAYKSLLATHQLEYDWITDQLSNAMTHIYAEAYRIHWQFDRQLVADWPKLYHGVTQLESIEITRQELERQLAEINREDSKDER